MCKHKRQTCFVTEMTWDVILISWQFFLFVFFCFVLVVVYNVNLVGSF